MVCGFIEKNLLFLAYIYSLFLIKGEKFYNKNVQSKFLKS